MRLTPAGDFHSQTNWRSHLSRSTTATPIGQGEMVAGCSRTQ